VVLLLSSLLLQLEMKDQPSSISELEGSMGSDTNSPHKAVPNKNSVRMGNRIDLCE